METLKRMCLWEPTIASDNTSLQLGQLSVQTLLAAAVAVACAHLHLESVCVQGHSLCATLIGALWQSLPDPPTRQQRPPVATDCAAARGCAEVTAQGMPQLWWLPGEARALWQRQLCSAGSVGL